MGEYYRSVVKYMLFGYSAVDFQSIDHFSVILGHVQNHS